MTDAFTDHAVQYIRQIQPRSRSRTSSTWPTPRRTGRCTPGPRTSRSIAASIERAGTRCAAERHARQSRMGIVKQVVAADAARRAGPRMVHRHRRRRQVGPADGGLRGADRPHGPGDRPRAPPRSGRSGQEDNTLILFLADNGGCHEERIARRAGGRAAGTGESFTSYGRPWANASNTPFRLFKHWVHEGGISSPFIAYWPVGDPQRQHAAPSAGPHHRHHGDVPGRRRRALSRSASRERRSPRSKA